MHRTCAMTLDTPILSLISIRATPSTFLRWRSNTLSHCPSAVGPYPNEARPNDSTCRPRMESGKLLPVKHQPERNENWHFLFQKIKDHRTARHFLYRFPWRVFTNTRQTLSNYQILEADNILSTHKRQTMARLQSRRTQLNSNMGGLNSTALQALLSLHTSHPEGVGFQCIPNVQSNYGRTLAHWVYVFPHLFLSLHICRLSPSSFSWPTNRPPRWRRANTKQKVNKLSARFQPSHGVCNSVQSDIDEVTSALLVYHHNTAIDTKKAPRRSLLLSVNVPKPYLAADDMDGKALDKFPTWKSGIGYQAQETSLPSIFNETVRRMGLADDHVSPH